MSNLPRSSSHGDDGGWTRPSIWKVRLGFGSAILTLAILGVLSYRSFGLSVKSEGWVRHTHEVIENLQDLQIAMVKLESSCRGFVLSGKESFLAAYQVNLRAVTRDEVTVHDLTVDNPTQQRRLTLLKILIAQRIATADTLIDLRRLKGLQAAADAMPVLQGQRMMSEFRVGVHQMQDEELRLLALRDEESKQLSNDTKMVLLFGIATGLLIVAAAGWSVQHDNVTRGLAESGMRESEERFRDLANNISQLAWMADEKGFIFWYNQRWFDYTGTSLEEMAGWGWQKVHHPDHAQAVVDKISRCFSTGEVWDDTFPLRGRDGEYRWFLSRAVPIRDAQGKVLRWFGTNTDISERRIAELHLAGRERALEERNEELAEALSKVREVSQHKSRFLANMSHELRTPLNGIIGFNEIIHDGRTGPVNDLQKEFLSDSLRSAKHLLSLINDLLDLEKIEAGRLVLHQERFDLGALVVETIDENKGIATAKELHLISDVGPEAMRVFLDRQKTKQILLNLIMNAIKFTPAGGRVAARARISLNQQVVVEIEDTGIGISELDQERLFREFEQIESSESKQYQGTGLGLALTRKLVEAQGGVVSVTSQVGIGSIFSVTLPVSHEFSAMPAAARDRADDTILVVESELETSPITDALNAAGHLTQKGGSIAETMHCIQRRRDRALVTALVLPGGTGLDLIREIRRREHGSDLPIFVVTGIPEKLTPQGFQVHDALTRTALPSEIAAMLERVDRTACNQQVLVVDDDPNVHKLIGTALRGGGLEVVSCSDGAAGLRAFHCSRPAAIVVDLLMPKLDGFNFIAHLQDVPGVSDIPVFVWTSLDLTSAQLRTLSRDVRQIIYKRDGGITSLIKALRKELPQLLPEAVS